MITVKKNAIKYKDSDGTVKDSGVLCQVGTFGVDLMQYATSFSSMFANAVFPDGYELTLNVPNFNGTCGGSFQYVKGLKKIKIVANNKENLVGFNYMFDNAKTIEIIDLSEFTRKISSFTAAFNSCFLLREIIGELDLSENVNSNLCMNRCEELVEVRFKQFSIFKTISFAHSSKLSDKSIQSIIDGLADLTGQTAQTLTLHATVKAKLTEEQIATITSKNWTLA